MIASSPSFMARYVALISYGIRVNASLRRARPHPLTPSPSALGEGEPPATASWQERSNQADSVSVVLLLGAAVDAGPTRAHAEDGHPARVQHGSCDELGPVAYQLTGVGPAFTAAGTPVPVAEIVGSDNAVPLEISETTLDASLSELVTSDFAIVAYESDEAMDHILILACGDVGGPLGEQMAGMTMPDDELAVWLSPQKDSGYEGLALIRAAGTSATLRIYLAEGNE
jgi:hypothetical protein